MSVLAFTGTHHAGAIRPLPQPAPRSIQIQLPPRRQHANAVSHQTVEDARRPPPSWTSSRDRATMALGSSSRSRSLLARRVRHATRAQPENSSWTLQTGGTTAPDAGVDGDRNGPRRLRGSPTMLAPSVSASRRVRPRGGRRARTRRRATAIVAALSPMESAARAPTTSTEAPGSCRRSPPGQGTLRLSSDWRPAAPKQLRHRNRVSRTRASVQVLVYPT
jgi:hypothetical protein